MKYLYLVLVFLAGGTSGWILGFKLGGPLTPVYAEGQNLIDSGCVSNIPLSWGAFKGTSAQGFVFEDSRGTIRVIKQPPCGSSAGSPRMDMMILRR